MSSILRSATVLYSLAGPARQAGSLTARKKIISLHKYQGVFNFNELRVRTAAVTSQKENIEQDNHVDLENLFFKLSVDIKRKNVSRNHFKNALEAVNQKGEIKHSYLMVLLKCCSEVSYTLSEEDRLRMAETVWKIATDLGVQFNIVHYNALLEIFVINHHKFSPLEFLNALESMNILPNLQTYGLLLEAYCLVGDMEGAKLILNKMKELDYPLRRENFNSLIQGYCVIGDLEQAVEILKIVEGKKMKPFEDSYAHLLCGYAKQGKINMLKEILNELPNKGIFLSDLNLLEIAWTLSINNYDEYVDMILERISQTENHNKIRYVFRLLDKKKEALALKLLETVNPKDFESYGKKILNFFAAYRNPQEILDICNTLQEKGFVDNSLGFVLKIIFLNKNEDFCISFIEDMKARKMPIKIHYYWPSIIKASKKGNSELLAILKRISDKNLLKDYESLWNVIFANYKLGENWKQDLENFTALGVQKSLLNRYFFLKLLKQNKLNEAEYLVNFSIDSFKDINFILNDLFTFIEINPNEHERVVDILYSIAHNFCNNLVSREANVEEFKKDNAVELTEIYSAAVMILLKRSFSEEIKQRILEIMLEKKMCIFPKVGSLIKDSSNSNLGDLVYKLMDPNLESKTSNSTLKENISKRNLTVSLEKISAKASLDHYIKLMINFARKDLFEEAIAVGEHLLALNKELKSKSKTKSLYQMFLNFIKQNKDLKMLEKALDLGVKLNIYKPHKFDIIVLSYLSIDDSVAVEKFCEYALRFGELSGCVKFLSTLISQGNNEAVKRLTNFLSVMHSKNLSMSYLVIALYEAGEEESAKEILKTKDFEFDENILKQACNFWFKTYNCDFFEKALKMFKLLDNFNRQSLYENLAQKYVSDNRIDDLNKLWLQIQEDSDLNEEFVQQMADFVKNPGERFGRTYKSMAKTLGKTDWRTQNIFLGLLKNGEFDVALNECIQGKVPNHLVLILLDALASEGKVSQVLELIKKLRLEKYIERASSKFLSANKLDEYFEFVNYIASEGKTARISECFKVGFFQPSLTTSDAHLEKYKALALQCLKEGNFIMPLVSYFVACVKIPGKLAQAEEIFDQYFDDFKTVPDFYLCNIAETTESASDFYENLLSSQKLKSHFFDHIHVFYDKIISKMCDENKLDCAISFLQRAVADGVKERLDSNLITLLNKKLKENGKSISF